MDLHASIQLFLDQTSKHAQENTVTAYRHALTRFESFALNRELKPGLILEYRARLAEDGIKDSTAASYLMALSLFLNWAVNMELIPKSPMPKMQISFGRPAKSGITAHELELLCAEAMRIKQHRHWGIAMRLGWHTGLRLSDVALLKRSSIDIDQSAIRTIPKKTRKMQRLVEIPVPEELIAALLTESGREFVFEEMAVQYTIDKHKTLSAQFCYLARSVGLHKGFHDFRRAYVTRNLEAGVSPAIVSELTGINLAQIMTYFRPSLASKREALGLVKRKENVA